MSTQKNQDEFYDKLRSQLYETSSWPSEYLYKFIVQTDTGKIEKIESIFDNMGAVIKTNPSKNGTYTSVSINAQLKFLYFFSYFAHLHNVLRCITLILHILYFDRQFRIQY